MKKKSHKLEDILADYSDALLAGKNVDREQVLNNYDGDRQELAELLTLIEVLDRGRLRPRQEFVERMKDLIRQYRHPSSSNGC